MKGIPIPGWHLTKKSAKWEIVRQFEVQFGNVENCFFGSILFRAGTSNVESKNINFRVNE